MISGSQAWLSRKVKHTWPQLHDAGQMLSIGNRIREAMESAGLNQSELARRIGVKKQAVSAMISGNTRAPTAENIFKISDVTGYEARWITTGKGPKTKREAAMEHLDISMLSPSNQAAIRAAFHAFEEQDDCPNSADG